MRQRDHRLGRVRQSVSRASRARRLARSSDVLPRDVVSSSRLVLWRAHSSRRFARVVASSSRLVLWRARGMSAHARSSFGRVPRRQFVLSERARKERRRLLFTRRLCRRRLCCRRRRLRRLRRRRRLFRRRRRRCRRRRLAARRFCDIHARAKAGTLQFEKLASVMRGFDALLDEVAVVSRWRVAREKSCRHDGLVTVVAARRGGVPMTRRIRTRCFFGNGVVTVVAARRALRRRRLGGRGRRRRASPDAAEDRRRARRRARVRRRRPRARRAAKAVRGGTCVCDACRCPFKPDAEGGGASWCDSGTPTERGARQRGLAVLVAGGGRGVRSRVRPGRT